MHNVPHKEVKGKIIHLIRAGGAHMKYTGLGWERKSGSMNRQMNKNDITNLENMKMYQRVEAGGTMWWCYCQTLWRDICWISQC